MRTFRSTAILALLVALVAALALIALGYSQDSAKAQPTLPVVAIDMVNNYVPGNSEDSAGGPPASCSNDIDNDGDTLTDDDDPDCWENNEDSVGAIDYCASIPAVGIPGNPTVPAGTDLWFDLVVKGVPSATLISK